MPEDKQWAADRVTILQGLGVLDPDGNPTGMLEIIKAADVVRLTQEEWQKERDAMLKVCNQCHSLNFAREQLERSDQMIREADRLMAQSLRIVGDLYKDGILKKAESYAYPFPDLLSFHDAPTVIEQRLFLMFLEHRLRAFQGCFSCESGLFSLVWVERDAKRFERNKANGERAKTGTLNSEYQDCVG